jgi:hypothetical protein
MSWANIKELIFQERKILDPAAAPEFPQDTAFETQHSALLAAYLNAKSNVDDAIRHFAETLEWPEMTPLETFFVNARLDFAWEIASILNTSRDGNPFIAYPAPDTCNTSELLEWLLIDIWPYGCGRFLQAQKWIAEQAVVPQREPARSDQELSTVKCVA